MATYPTSPRADFLAWCQAHQGVFQTNAAGIGLLAGQVTAFKNAITAATDAANAQEIARQTAKAATITVEEKFSLLQASAAEMVRTIRAYAENNHNNNVYALAQIPPPATPGPVPPPAQPVNLRAELDAPTGNITIRWKCAQPEGAAGTSYIIRRRAHGQTEFQFLGVAGGGGKVFVDTTLAAGPDSVSYTVQGQRADASGPVSEILTVNFGRAQGGQLAITDESRRAA